MTRTFDQRISHSTKSYESDLLDLTERMSGRLVRSGDLDWDEARQAWNLLVDQQPLAVALVETASDVVAVVKFAVDHNLRVAPQATGHGAFTHSKLGDTILIKTSLLRGVEIDDTTGRARVAAGAVWQDVIEPAADHGFIVLHGSAPDVGVVGYTLGGGIGWYARSLGLAANSVTAVELVTADGRLVRADHENEPDLFWAVRGGGGSYGVITAIEIKLFETPELYGGAMFWPVEEAGKVLRAWRDWADTVPVEVTSLGRILHFPRLPDIPEPLRGGSFVVVEAVYTGPEALGAELVSPLRKLEPAIDTFAAVAPSALQHLHMDPPGPVPAIADGILIETLPDEAIDAFVATGVPPLLTLEIRHLGGAVAVASAEHGAAGSIDAGYVMFTAGIAPTSEAELVVTRAVDAATSALSPWEANRRYFNFAHRPIETSRLYPPDTYQRLRTIKTANDPAETLLADHPITPHR